MTKLLWWLYFAVMAANLGLLVVTEPFEPGTWISAAIGVVALVGLAGYILRRPLGSPAAWKIVFVAMIADFAFHAFTGIRDRQSDLLLAGLAMAALLMLPWFIALWRRGFPTQAA